MRFLATLAFLLAPTATFAAWGYTDDGSNYVIDTDANLVVKVNKTNLDLTSIKYRGIEYNGQAGKNSQVESGLDVGTVKIRQYHELEPPSNVIKITFKMNPYLVHTLVFRKGDPNVYIFLNKKDNTITTSRYVVRIPPNIFTNDIREDNDWIPDNARVIEADDVNARLGQTWSKHYSGKKYGRTMDYDYVGYKNANVGMYLIRSNHERASGGPFFRSSLRRGGADGADLYEVYHSNMGHTDVMRFGLHGPSVLHFTDNGTLPNSNLFARKADWGWMDKLGIEGWVPASQRTNVDGGLINMKPGATYVASLNNSQAQYWADASGGWKFDRVLPGEYTITIYRGELEVRTSTVRVQKGDKTVSTPPLLPDDPADIDTTWRIGDWDGTPKGFLNFEDSPMRLTYMHPSDNRSLTNWATDEFIDINDGRTILFRVGRPQLRTSARVRVGVTEGQAGGRPVISINGRVAYVPEDKGQSDTRSLTVGTYRGNNYIYNFIIPRAAWNRTPGAYQVLKIHVASEKNGSGYLSPGFSLDAIDMARWLG